MTVVVVVPLSASSVVRGGLLLSLDMMLVFVISEVFLLELFLSEVLNLDFSVEV